MSNGWSENLRLWRWGIIWWDIKRKFAQSKCPEAEPRQIALEIANSWTWRPEFQDLWVWGIVFDENQGKEKAEWVCLR